jgi:AraC family transcriptional regulator, regulatory protein of adaptative response / methylated-DNA-[protein]-cysteine methyltransferase
MSTNGLFDLSSTTGPAGYETDREKWDAILLRDFAANDSFYYAVKTTRVYCRPTCPSRIPLRTNVTFYTSREDAERNGYRPCKRCQPNGLSLVEEYAAMIEKACRTIENADVPLSLDQLARSAGMSKFHFQKIFTSIAGVSPKMYASVHRAQTVRRHLSQSNSISDAIYESGYQSDGRFYAESTRVLGMEPSAFRKGGSGAKIQFAVGECKLGSILVASTQRGVCTIALGDDPDLLVQELQDRFSKADLVAGDDSYQTTVATVIRFVDNPRFGLNLPLDLQGTLFQQRVWQALMTIPAGQTATYAEIAAKIGKPNAVRAVAQGCAANTLAVAIPCHRVVRTDGSISGYRWGVERKRALLKHEKLALLIQEGSETPSETT